MSATATKPETATAAEPLHIIALEVENVKKVKALHVEPNGKSLIVSGKNGSGKTSVLDALMSALAGDSRKAMPEPIHKGEKNAEVRVDIGEYQIVRRWTPKGSKLVVTAKDGSEIPKAQDLLTGLIAKRSLDPVAFLQQRDQDMIDDVLSCAAVPIPVKEVEEITGESIPALPGESADTYLLRLSRDDVGVFFVQRREAHRLCTHKQAAALEQRRALDQLGGPLTDNDALVPLSETLQEITALQGIQQDRRNAINEAEEAASELRKGQAKLNQMRDDANKLSAEADRLFQQLEKIKAERDLLQEKIKRSGEIVDALAEQADAATAHIETLPDVSPRIAALQSSIATAESTNKALAKRQALQEEHKRLDLEAEAAKLHHEHLDGIVDRLRDMRRHLLDGVDLGCDGLQIGDGELLLNGVTFKQASQAERLRVALAVSMRQNPRLRLLRIDGGEQLDSASRQLVLSTARERDYQVIMATVSDGEKLAVEIVEE